jgi:starch synthase (maltosyl-transferring)
VRPCVENGKYDAKTVVGDRLTITADAFVDGHDLLRVEAQYRVIGERSWTSVVLSPLGNDAWQGSITPLRQGRYEFFVSARVDHFASWLRDLRARVDAGQDVAVELEVGHQLIEAAVARAKGLDKRSLTAVSYTVGVGSPPDRDVIGDAELVDLVARNTKGATTSSPTYHFRVERERARFTTWYELFPRSTSPKKKTHGTFADVHDRLGYLADLGVDVLYLPPVHPIGTTARKGRNGAAKAKRGDVGSPWAIGAPEGGHTAIHPQLGTMDDFHNLVVSAASRGIEVALDIAFQCSPDHPWVTEHPQWFAHRPDGSIRYAENPPKRYEDVYPLSFETEDWRALWDALRDVFEFWIDNGVRVFRVDNPHTKPFGFWEWVIPSLQADHDGLIFLAEAFTRPKVMKRLAKLGFTQSYTYFAWRTEKWEFEEYLNELVQTDVADYFRPSFWPNTPDILTEQLQHGDRHLFMTRALLAGTMAASYGIYGPVFELCETAPRHEGSEEYLDSEKYQLRQFDLDSPTTIAPFLRTLNTIRREHNALQHNETLRFHQVDNEAIIAYSKTVGGVAGSATGPLADAPVVVIANLDATHQQTGWVHLDLDRLGLDADAAYHVHDLLTGERYEWKGQRNFVILDPTKTPGHLFRIEPVVVGAR